MNTQFIIDQAANNLQQHENSRRIKKLIFCACKNSWENDQETLDKFEFIDLIQELCSFNPTLEHVNYTLTKVVNTLNKPGEYSIVANVILNEIEKLYIINEELTGIIFNQPYPEEATGIISNQIQPQILSNPLEEFTNPEIKYEYNQFDLRQNIMKYTNPLRAKLVLLFALNNKSYFQEEDWLKLRAEELDNLLEKLFDSCSTIGELEFKINNAVISLGNQDENTQAAGAIIQSMRGLYNNISATSNQNQNQKMSRYSSEETSTLANPHLAIAEIDEDDDMDIYEDNEDDKDNTCQLIAPPTKYPFNKKQ
ncbi:hypothetical protein [Anabaena sp. UHCC 0451]|uniref:hypothetical protein n=1 Tax=Anabaena sp. UHCC 0451 TaxID=2055235 RepID=UPI002B1EF104|nr:hypothetical protein [Anabaena sp. UHCC 0451]MEA5579400.1 hypothetical protein [Anabaena sp. UHCC 0451]